MVALSTGPSLPLQNVQNIGRSAGSSGVCSRNVFVSLGSMLHLCRCQLDGRGMLLVSSGTFISIIFGERAIYVCVYRCGGRQSEFFGTGSVRGVLGETIASRPGYVHFLLLFFLPSSLPPTTTGVPLAPAFSRRSTHLLCPSGTGAKFDKAKAWGVPVVGMGWMEDMVRTGMVGAVERFLVGGMEVGVGGSAGRDAKDKGKEKEMVDVMMVDITNSKRSLPMKPLNY